MTLHVGGAYGNKASAIQTFVAHADMLSHSARACLTIENDDTTFDIDDVLTLCEHTGLPAVFDFFHHQCHHRRDHWLDGLPELLERVVATWGERVPKFHLSSAREPGKTAHADYLREEDLATALALMQGVRGDEPYDLMLEAKVKEKAVVRLLETSLPQQAR
jgi:UV DNA damage endonuclease